MTSVGLSVCCFGGLGGHSKDERALDSWVGSKILNLREGAYSPLPLGLAKQWIVIQAGALSFSI